MLKTKRVLVCEFHQESNTFNPVTAGIERFQTAKSIEGLEAYEKRKEHPCLLMPVMH